MNGALPDTAERARGGALALLNDLNEILCMLEVEVEFYFMGGAVLLQAFSATPRTAHISAMFRPASVILDAASKLGRRQGLPESWLQSSVRSTLAGGFPPGKYLELSNLRAFVPLPEYALAVKCAGLRVDAASGDLEDIRYILRAMNINSADQAMSVIGQYFSERQLVPGTRELLAALLGEQESQSPISQSD